MKQLKKILSTLARSYDLIIKCGANINTERCIYAYRYRHQLMIKEKFEMVVGLLETDYLFIDYSSSIYVLLADPPGVARGVFQLQIKI